MPGKFRVDVNETPNPALETDQNARFAGDLAAQLSRCAEVVGTQK